MEKSTKMIVIGIIHQLQSMQSETTSYEFFWHNRVANVFDFHSLSTLEAIARIVVCCCDKLLL